MRWWDPLPEGGPGQRRGPRHAQRIRLGDVSGYDEATFVIPDYLVRTLSTLRFLADPLAGNRAPVSQEVLVERGDTVGIYIPSY